MGCRDKEAAKLVIEKNPKSIHEALDMIRSSIANHQAVYGMISFDMSKQNTSDKSLEIKVSNQPEKIDQLDQKNFKIDRHGNWH